MHLQLADQSICYPEGVLEEVVMRVVLTLANTT